MKTFLENLRGALRALRENWLRSALTMLGIVIGVASIVLVFAIGQGVKRDVMKQIESLGANVVFIVPGKLERSGQPNPMSTLGISTLTERDLGFDLVPEVSVEVVHIRCELAREEFRFDVVIAEKPDAFPV